MIEQSKGEMESSLLIRSKKEEKKKEKKKVLEKLSITLPSLSWLKEKKRKLQEKNKVAIL